MIEDFSRVDHSARDAFFTEKVLKRHAAWELFLFGKMKSQRDPHLVADIIQDFYVKVLHIWEQVPQETESSTKAFLFTILHRELINHFRRGKAQPQSDDLSLASELPGEAFDPATQQMVEYVQELITTCLSEEDQLIMRLRAIEDYSYQEIADIMGMPIDTVSTRIHRARKELRKKI